MARRGRGRGRGFIQALEVPEEETKSEISYMQPEILPVHIMEELLRERGLNASILLKADRKLIIRYFYKHISPKYQRDYRENRRGKILKKMRQRKERKIDDEDWKKLIVESTGKRPSSQYSSGSVVGSSSRDRLKPPPSSTFKSPPKNLDEIIIKEHKPRSKNNETDKDKDGDTDKKRKEVEYSDKDVKKIKTDDSSEKRKLDTVEFDSGPDRTQNCRLVARAREGKRAREQRSPETSKVWSEKEEERRREKKKKKKRKKRKEEESRERKRRKKKKDRKRRKKEK